MRKIDLTGHKYARWTVLNEDKKQGKHLYWRCQCDCGSIGLVSTTNLRQGQSFSCGCHSQERKTKHGHNRPGHRTPEHMIWNAMTQRCHNPKDKNYHYYGGRGIKVCDEWRSSYLAFFNHIGPRPNPKLSIDRIYNNGNYEPGNVRWATRSQQTLNQRIRKDSRKFKDPSSK